jgi:tetratricopeptide (TPR) repeat protein
MAEIYFRIGQLDESIENYKRALEIKPDFISARHIAYIYAMKEDYDGAFRWLSHYITVTQSPGLKAVGYWVRGFYHYWTGRFDQSLNDAQNAKDLWQPLKHQWGEVAAELTKGCVYYEKGEYELSRNYFNKVYDYVKDYRDFVLYEKAMFKIILGYLDVMEGKIDSAKVRLDEIKSLLPKLAERHYWNNQINIAYNLLQMEVLVTEGAYKKAIALREKLIFKEIPDMNPKTLWFLNISSVQDVLARAYIQNGELDKAISEYKKLITFDPEGKNRRLIHPKYHYRIAKLYQEKGQPDKAVKEYKACLEIWKDADKDMPEFIDAKKQLAGLEMQNK